MKVWVVMGNDYPDCVFDNIEAAERFVETMMKDPENRHELGGTPKIYWRSYEFELQR